MNREKYLATAVFVLTPCAAIASDGEAIPSSYWYGLLVVLVLCLAYAVFRLYRELERAHEKLGRQRAAEEDTARETGQNCKVECERYGQLFDMALAGMFRSTLDGKRFVRANEAVARLYGCDSAEELCLNVRPVDVYEAPELRTGLMAALREQRVLESREIVFRDVNGRRRPMLASFRLCEEEGVIEGTVLDLTARRKVEQELERQNLFLQELIDAIPTPLFYKSADARYRLANSAFYRTTGTSAETIIGKNVYDLNPANLAQEYEKMDSALLNASGHASQRYESQLQSKNGLLDVVFNKQTLLDDEGKVCGLLGVVTDITRQKRRNRELLETGAMIDALLNSLTDMVFFRDLEHRLRKCNNAFADFWGSSEDELCSPNSELHLFTGAAEDLNRDDGLVQSERRSVRFETSVRSVNGERLLEVVKNPMLTHEGELLGVVGVARDVTDRHRMEEALRHVETRYRAIFENAVEGIFVSTPDGAFVESNKAMAALIGYETPEALMSDITDIGGQLFMRREDRSRMLQILAEEGVLVDHEVQWKRLDSSTCWVSLSSRAIFDQHGRMQYIQGIASDVSLRKAAEVELERRATTDPLTGLPNRSHLLLSCSRYLVSAAKEDRQVGLMFMDLDGFKQINDLHGHVVGDDVIRQVAERLRTRLQRMDIAARIGGDEFALLLWDVQGPDDLERTAREIIDMISGDYQCGPDVCRLGLSVGSSLYPLHGESVEELLAKADQAMYEVKLSGKSGYRLAE